MGKKLKQLDPPSNGAVDHDEPPNVMQEAEPTSAEIRRPVHEFSYATGQGSWIWVSIWQVEANVNGEQKTFHNVSWQRSYWAGEWKTAKNVRGGELYILIHALNQANAWIIEASR